MSDLFPSQLPPATDDLFHLLVAQVEEYAIYLLDPSGRVISWNAGAERLKGYHAAEIIGQNFACFYLAADRATGRPAADLARARNAGHYEEEGWRLRKDGQPFWAMTVLTALYGADGQLQGFGKVTRDMTAQRAAAEHLRQSEERFRLLVESVRDYAIFMLDPAGRIVSWNTGASLIKGYTTAEVIGHSFSLFYPPEDQAAGIPSQILAQATTTGRFEGEGWRVRKDGSRFWANVLLTAVYDAHGTLRGFAKVTRDLTAQRLAAAQAAQLQIQEQQLERERVERLQMEALMQVRNRWVTVTAHELRTPVTALLGHTQILARRLEQGSLTPDRMQTALRVVSQQARRLDRLTTMLLDLIQLDQAPIVLHPQPLDLTALIRQISIEAQALTTQHTLVVVAPDGPLWLAGDALRLETVFLNLLQNAIKYTPQGGTITITLAATEQEAIVSVSDPGIGIPLDEQPHIFERFYRASNVLIDQTTGLGIGLYLVESFVALHGGRLSLTSEPGVGTTIMVALPLPLAEQPK